MARLPRLWMPGVPEHLIVRGINRQVIFHTDSDRIMFHRCLCGYVEKLGIDVHAYVLMPNHVHLLLTARDYESAFELDRILRLSYELQRPEIRLIHARRYLLGCMRYIELNPVRAHMVEQPGQYRWSSYRANALGYVDPVVAPHPLYFALGRSAEERRRAYARFVERNHFGAAASP